MKDFEQLKLHVYRQLAPKGLRIVECAKLLIIWNELNYRLGVYRITKCSNIIDKIYECTLFYYFTYSNIYISFKNINF